MEKHSVGQTIAALRKKKGWTQVELAEKLQVSDKAVSKWEKDDSYPSIEFLPVLASLFGVTIDYLITGATKSEKVVANTPKKVEEEILADDPRILTALHDNILSIDEVLATKNYNLIKKALETYPITAYEIHCTTLECALQFIKNNDWRSLLKYAVDNEYHHLTPYVLSRDSEACSKILNNYLEKIDIKTFSDETKSNEKYLNIRKSFFVPTTHKAKLAFIETCKKQILDDFLLKFDMEKIVEDLDQTYFQNELAKGNFEIVIIKLCVRLEAILRGKYHYEGEFSEMLNEYCSNYGREDDGWGYYVEASFVKYLHKLRKCRNNIVHSEKNEEAMTIDEISFCIEYICRMD